MTTAKPPKQPSSAPPREQAPSGLPPKQPSSAPPRDPPPPGARALVVFLGGRTAFGLAHLVGAARDLPIPWYRPQAREWVFGPRPPFFAMEWFGRSLASALVACVAAALLWALTARGPLARALRRPSFVTAVGQAAALALFVDLAYFGWLFLTQDVSPLPLPAPGLAR